MFKKSVQYLLLLSLGFTLAACDASPSSSSSSEGQDTEQTSEVADHIQVTYQIKTDEGLQKEFQASVESGSHVLDILKEYCDVEESDGFVESIDGISQGGEHYWMYYVDGEMANVGAADFVLEDGQKVEWRLEAMSSEE